MVREAEDYHLLSSELSHLECANVGPPARMRSEQATDGEAVRSDPDVVAVRQKLKREDNHTETEECDCEPTHLLARRDHENATSNKGGTEKQPTHHLGPARAEDVCMLGVHRNVV